jgi:ornithine carbamoyltransferase
MLRTFAHENVRELAKWSRVPVINGLCDLVHPCQGLCDFFTISEKKGALKGKTIAYVGDGNNVAHSLIFGAAKTGMHIVLGVPAGYEPQAKILEASEDDRKKTGGSYKLTHDPAEAVKGADVIYTDVWVSMGQDEETAKRKRDLAPFQVNGALLGKAKPDAIFMHCLPAHRGDEVTDEVADHARSVIFDQAENRMHTQKTLMVELMGR